MCWACLHPDATWADYLEHLRGMVSWHGWAIQAVEREGYCPPWAYTVGLTQMGRPELVVTGMAIGRAGQLLSEVAGHLGHSEPPAIGEIVELVGGPAIQVAPITMAAARLPVAADLYGNGVSGLQVIHADDRGRWPWEAGYRGIRGGQPILGAAELRAAS